MSTWLIVGLVVVGVAGVKLGEEAQRQMRIIRRGRIPARRWLWLCRHGIHRWPWPPYDSATCMRCGKPYLEP